MIPPHLPSPAALEPLLEKLERNPGSVILIAISQPEVCNYANVSWSWLSSEERKAIKAALLRMKAKREKNPAPATPTLPGPSNGFLTANAGPRNRIADETSRARIPQSGF